MEKVARNRSEDPVQEALRQHKADWNAGVSDFIGALISLKKGLNGRPVSELNLGQGDIRLPLPDIIPSLLDRLTGEYERIASDGRSIVQEQDQYSEHRRQPQQVQMANDGLNKEASNMFSRLWTYTKLPFQWSDKDRWTRKNMLQAASDLQDKLGDIGVFIVSSDEKAIPAAVYGMKSFISIFENNIVKPAMLLAESKQEKGEPIPGQISGEAPKEEVAVPEQEPEKKLKPVKKKPEPPVVPQEEPVVIDNNQYEKVTGMEEDVKNNIVPNINHIMSSIGVAVGKDPAVIGPIKDVLSDLEPLIVDFYIAIKAKAPFTEIHQLYNDIKEKYNVVFIAAGKIKLIEALLDIDPGLQKFAKGRFKRWLGRAKQQFFKAEDYRLRTDADDLISEADESLNTLMDSLQTRSVPIGDLIKNIADLGVILGGMLDIVNKLGHIHNNKVKMDRLNAKSKGKRFIETNTINESDLSFLVKSQNKLDEMQVERVKLNGLDVQYIKNPSEQVQLAAIKQNPIAIQYINDPSEQVQLAVIKQNPEAIQYIKIPSAKAVALWDKAQVERVKLNGLDVQHIKNPSEQVQLASIKQNPAAIKHIKKPSASVVALWNRLYAK